jgi:hypothetical protein
MVINALTDERGKRILNRRYKHARILKGNDDLGPARSIGVGAVNQYHVSGAERGSSFRAPLRSCSGTQTVLRVGPDRFVEGRRNLIGPGRGGLRECECDGNREQDYHRKKRGEVGTPDSSLSALMKSPRVLIRADSPDAHQVKTAP